MIKEKNPNFKGFWVRYKDYEIVKLDSEFYIKPSEKSDYEIYDVFDEDKELLVDFLLMGKAVNDAEKNNSKDVVCDLISTEKEYQNMALQFVEKYGLLGQLTYVAMNNNLTYEKKAYIQGKNKIEAIQVEEHIKKFFKADDKIDFNKELSQEDLYYLYGIDNPYMHLNKEAEYGLIFSRKYSEKIANILFYAKFLYKIFWAVESCLLEEDFDKKGIYRLYASDFIPTNLAFELVLKDKAYLQWNFNSLKRAIETILALNESNDRKEVKMCKHCTKPFIAKNLQSDYCSATCRGVANTYKTRARKKGK